ncbi:Ras-related protein Rab-4B [Channa argus]|uniref:Ras-related protein Rab-4 n=1 Tax=Channa argus TaxID=215402 RepID=A0A6G1PRJ1_CHAAH|nr:Ras-related protein Rab-4B [Channa argus]
MSVVLSRSEVRGESRQYVGNVLHRVLCWAREEGVQAAPFPAWNLLELVNGVPGEHFFILMFKNSQHFLFKFLVIGSAGTGKSCLLHQFIENKFKQDSNHTIGVEFGSRVVNVGGKTVKLQIWDTAGQERFRSVTRSYYRGAAGALLVYDITSRETYNALTNWLTDARTLASPNIVIILCGNKKDLDADREVTFLEASRFAQENELMFLETSALTGENVEEGFLKCARTILNKIDSGELDPERMGSGIQYGDASLRQLRQPRGTATQNKQQCNC